MCSDLTFIHLSWVKNHKLASLQLSGPDGAVSWGTHLNLINQMSSYSSCLFVVKRPWQHHVRRHVSVLADGADGKVFQQSHNTLREASKFFRGDSPVTSPPDQWRFSGFFLSTDFRPGALWCCPCRKFISCSCLHLEFDISLIHSHRLLIVLPDMSHSVLGEGNKRAKFVSPWITNHIWWVSRRQWREQYIFFCRH